MTTTVATRRSVLSGLAVSALALAAMASFVLISVSGGAGAQDQPRRLNDIALPECTDDCTDAELVLFSPYSNLSTTDPDETRDAGYNFYGDGGDNIVYTVNEDLSTPSSGGHILEPMGESSRNADLSEADGRLYVTVVNESRSAVTDPERVQNAIVAGSDIFGIAVYDEDAATPQDVSVTHDNVPDVVIRPAPNLQTAPAVRNLTENFTDSASGNIFIHPQARSMDGALILPIRGNVTFHGIPMTPGSAGFGEMSDITSRVNPNIINRGDPEDGTSAVISYLSTEIFNSVEIRWSTVASDNFVVVEVDGNATSPVERLYLRLNETSRGSSLYVGEVQLFSSGPDRNNNAYVALVSQSGTQTVSTVLVDDDEGNDIHVIGQSSGIVRAPFIAHDRDNITVRFRDKTGVTGTDNTPVTDNLSASVVVESEAPTIVVTAPENDSATSNRQINFSGTASDADSGLDVTELRLGIANPQDAGADPVPAFDFTREGDGAKFIGPNGHIGMLPEGFTATTRTRILVGTEDANNSLYRDGTNYVDGVNVVDWGYTPDNDNRLAEDIANNMLSNDITFSLVAVDLAGNVGFSDSDEGNAGMNPNNFRDNFQLHTIRLDGSPPALADDDSAGEIRYDNSDVIVYRERSQTGILWDVSEGDLVVARNAIAVVFDNPVQPPSLSDFSVNWDDDNFAPALEGVVPSPSGVDATRLDGESFFIQGSDPRRANANGTAVKNQIERTVFLVFDQNIPSSETPRINVSGVMDLAGNSIGTNANVEAADGLGPGVEVTLSGGSGTGSDEDRQGPGTLTNEDILVEIQVNEQGTNPLVSFYQANGTSLSSGSVGIRSGSRGENRFSYLFQRDQLAGAHNGVVCVVVSARDNASAQNTTMAGVSGSTDEACNDNSNAIFFTLDRTAPHFEDGANYTHPPVFDTRPIIQIPLDGAVDISEGVTLRINGEEVETTDATLRTSDNRVFVYQPPVGSELTFDTHRVEFRATDFAGNRSPFRLFNITISQRSDFKLALSSGWNLISFPSDPINPRVSAVFDNSSIRVVSTFDAANFRAGNQMATRNPVTGSYSGNLSEVSTGLAYWVFSEAFTNISVRLQGPQAGTAGQIPTAITIPTVGGVNLVGVVDPSLRNTQGDAGGTIERGGSNVTVADYLENVSQSRVQVYNSTTGTFDGVDDGDDIETGMGLIVYINPDITGRTPDIIP